MKLEIGYDHPFEVRRYSLIADACSGMDILYLSDLHFNRYSGPLADRMASAIHEINPGVILLGGDYADSPKGLYYFEAMMRSISGHQHIYAIRGNHEWWSTRRVRAIVERCHGVWLHNSSVMISSGGLTIRIDGGRPSPLNTPADVSILCLHQPVDISQIPHRYNLVFAGHLHGGQIVLRSTDKGLYPGRLLYKWNRLSAQFGNCQYLISKGIGDMLPVRYNCKRDMILVNIL